MNFANVSSMGISFDSSGCTLPRLFTNEIERINNAVFGFLYIMHFTNNFMQRWPLACPVMHFF